MLMTNLNGYIRLYRSILQWEWYDDINTYRLFTHLLYTVNWKDGRWHGIEIKRGQRITSISKLAKETKLSVRNVRTALSNLQNSGEVTCKATSKWTLVTVENYAKFQGEDNANDKQTDKQVTRKLTNERQASDKQATTNEEIKEIKKEKEVRKKEEVAFVDLSTGKEVTEAEADAHVERLMKGIKI